MRSSAMYGDQWLSSMTTTKRNFPRSYFMVRTKQHLFDVWATTEMEAFRTLYEMSLYHDFHLLFTEIYRRPRETRLKLPTLLLKKILKKAINHICFEGIDIVSALAGRVLASSGRSKTIHFDRCVFRPAAEEAFVDEMLSKADKNSGCTGLHIGDTLPFSSDQILARLIDGQVLKDLSFFSNHSAYSEQLLISLRNSQTLQSLDFYPENFISFDDFAGFVSSLHSSSLQRLRIHHWNFDRAAFPVEIFRKLFLKEFSMMMFIFLNLVGKVCGRKFQNVKH